MLGSFPVFWEMISKIKQNVFDSIYYFIFNYLKVSSRAYLKQVAKGEKIVDDSNRWSIVQVVSFGRSNNLPLRRKILRSQVLTQATLDDIHFLINALGCS